ncbi:hypothetical protein FJ366_03920, partial [Candidatus Dependentiae bacterium]|nr:hypothetical protein [Candidatus Dependentiae bacterium]
MSKQTALRSILFSILTFSIIPIFCPPKTKTPRRVALSIKALPSIVGLYTMLQTLTPQIIIHSEPHMAKCQELCSCIDSMTSCNLERFKKTYAEHLFTPAEGNFFDKDPFTLGYLFGIEAHKREKIIGKSQETGAKAIALVIMLIPLFDEIDDSLAKKFLAFISGYQYFMLSHREESTIPPIEELPKQNEDTFISFLLGMNAATTSIMGEPNLSPTTIVDHAFNCGYYIQIYLNKKEVAAPVADATPFLITDHTVATERPPREYVRTTNECYASGILLERSLSPMLHDTTAMSDQLTSFLAAEILKLSTTPTTLMGPIFQTCGALEFYSLRQLKLFAPSADHLETTLINKCFENGYNCSYDNLCTYISKNFTKKRDLVRNLSNLLMRAYIAGAILKMIVQAHLKEKTSIAYISVEVFIQTKDRWLAVIESLEDKATKSTSSNGAAASATSTRTYEEAKAAEEELLALLAAEEEEREAQKLSKSQAQERKKIRQRALAEQRKKEALEL